MNALKINLFLIVVFFAAAAIANDCIEGNCKNGYGIYLHNSGKKYEGQWENGRRHGKGKQTHTYDAMYEGDWKNDKMDGYGMKTYPDGFRYEGEWKNGLKHGHGTMTNSLGQTYVGEWKYGYQNGKGTFFRPLYNYPDKWSKYIGDFKNGMKHGKGKEIFDDGYILSGMWFNDRHTGELTATCMDGRTYKAPDPGHMISVNLKKWRNENNYSTDELAELLIISPEYLRKLEKKSKINIKVYLRMKCYEKVKQ